MAFGRSGRVLMIRRRRSTRIRQEDRQRHRGHRQQQRRAPVAEHAKQDGAERRHRIGDGEAGPRLAQSRVIPPNNTREKVGAK
jgi:hypothetical protein